jgi:hypothetical protein
MTIDPNKLAAQGLDVAAALLVFVTQGYALWVLGTIALPALPVMGHTYSLDLEHVYAALGMLAVWRGLALPGAGSWMGSLKSAGLYAVVGFATAWLQGEAPTVPTVFDEFSISAGE